MENNISEKVLIKEKVVKSIENEIKKIENELKDVDIKKMKISKWIIFFIITFFPILFMSLVGFVTNLKAGVSILEALKITMGITSFFSSFTLPFFGLGGLVFLGCETIANKKNLKDYEGKQAQVEYLKAKLTVESAKLEKLKKELPDYNKIENLLCDKRKLKEELKIIKNYLEVYYDLGYNEDKYSKYYNKGLLNSKLDNYSKEELEVAKKYLEERGPILAKRKKN